MRQKQIRMMREVRKLCCTGPLLKSLSIKKGMAESGVQGSNSSTQGAEVGGM